MQVVRGLDLYVLRLERHPSGDPVVGQIQAVVRHTDNIRCIGLDAGSLLIAACGQFVQPERLLLAVGGPYLEGNDLAGAGMPDGLHVVGQGDGLPPLRLCDTRLHRVVVGVGYLLGGEGARTVEVIVTHGVGQFDSLGLTVHHGVLVCPGHTPLVVHVEQEVRVAHQRLERSRGVPDDGSEVGTVGKRILPYSGHLPGIIRIRYGSRHLHSPGIVA